MKKQFLVLLILGAFVSQVQGAEQSNQEAIVSSLQNYLDFVNGDDITPLLAGGQVVKRTQLSKAFAKLKNNDLDAEGKNRLIANLSDFSEVVKDLLKPKATRVVGKLTQKQLEEAEVARKREAEFARLAQEAQDALANKKKTAEEERLAAEKAEQEAQLLREKEEADKAARAEKTRIANEKFEIAKRVKAEKLEQQRLEQERIAAEKAELARLEAEKLRIAQEQEARRIKLEAEQRAAEEAATVLRIAQQKEAARLERERIALENLRIEEERLAKEQEALKLLRLAELEKVRLAEIERQERMERERLVELERVAQAERQRIVAEELAAANALRAAEEMRKYQEEQERAKQRTRAEKEAADRAANQRMIELAKERSEGLIMTCANCPNKTCAGCSDDPADQCPDFNKDGVCRSALRHPGEYGYTNNRLINIRPINFDMTLELVRARSGNSGRRDVLETEYSTLFRLLYDCARGFYEDPNLELWEKVKEEERAYYKKVGIEAPDLRSWVEKFPLFIKTLKEKGFALDNLVNNYFGGTYGDSVAEYFIKNGTLYEKEIFKNTNSNIYMYLRNLIEYNLRSTDAGRRALDLAREVSTVDGEAQRAAEALAIAELAQQQESARKALEEEAAEEAERQEAMAVMIEQAEEAERQEAMAVMIEQAEEAERLEAEELAAEQQRAAEALAAAAVEEAVIPQVVAVAYDPTMDQARESLLAKLNSAENPTAEAAVIEQIPGFRSLSLEHQKCLMPQKWVNKSPQYYIAQVAVQQVVNYVYGTGSGKLGDSNLERLQVVQPDFMEMYQAMLSNGQIGTELNLTDDEVQRQIGHAVHAIMELNRYFRETAHAEVVLSFADDAFGLMPGTSIAEVTAGGAPFRPTAAGLSNDMIQFVTKVYRDLVLAEDSQDPKVRRALPQMRAQLVDFVQHYPDVLKLTEDQIKEILVDNGFRVDNEERVRVFRMIEDLQREVLASGHMTSRGALQTMLEHDGRLLIVRSNGTDVLHRTGRLAGTLTKMFQDNRAALQKEIKEKMASQGSPLSIEQVEDFVREVGYTKAKLNLSLDSVNAITHFIYALQFNDSPQRADSTQSE